MHRKKKRRPFESGIMERKICLVLLILGIRMECSASKEKEDSVSGKELKEIVVTGSSAMQRQMNPRLGAERLELSKLVMLPSFGGENDIIKSITLLPGVRSEGEGGGGFEVRGGNAAQNLLQLDGISLYNASHVMGIFSTFNDNAIGGATLFKGPMPSMYGNATSSVLETTLAPGNSESFHGSASIGLLAAKVKVEGPVIKDKLSFAVTARRSYIDAFLKLMPDYKNTVMNFYDITAKLRYRPASSNMIDYSFFISRDNLAISRLMGMNWGNLGSSVNWIAHAGENWTFNTLVAFTHFNPEMWADIADNSQTMWTYIRNYSINERAVRVLSHHSRLEIGYRSELFNVKSGEWDINGTREKEIRSLWTNSFWGEYSGRFFGEKLDIACGMRVSLSTALSGSRFHKFESATGIANEYDSKIYIEGEPRVSLKFNINSCNSITGGFGVSTQNLHAIRANSTSFPFDRYALTSAAVRPERAVQYGLGYNGMTSKGDYDWSVEGYYKDIFNVYDFKDGKSTFSSISLENIILGGEGRSYGVEFMFRKNTGSLTGWISYTLSHTETRIGGINGGKWYNSTNDRRHDFSITGIYAFSDKWSVSGSWIFISGQPLTAPDAKYQISGQTCYYYSARNSYKTPPTHRLDLSATYKHQGKKFSYEWSFGVYNTYCRYNAYVVYFKDDRSKPSGTVAVQQSLYGIVPSVSYTLKF